MKKLILLLSVCTLALTSCGSDDDVSQIEQSDVIIGTWKYSMSLVNGVDDGLLPCENEDSFVFDSNGTVLETYYDEAADGSCFIGESYTSTWTNNGNGSYSLIDDGESFEYILDGNKLTYTLSFDNGTPSDTSDDFTESEVYTKQ